MARFWLTDTGEEVLDERRHFRSEQELIARHDIAAT